MERSHRKDNEYFYASHTCYSFVDFKKQLAICIRDSSPSYIRAPPETVKPTTGNRRSDAVSNRAVIFSPVALSMLPIIK